MDALRLLDWTSYEYAYQYVFCQRTPTFVEVLGVSGVVGIVEQLPGHLNSYLQSSSMPLLLNQDINPLDHAVSPSYCQ